MAATGLVQGANEQGSRARADRYFNQGQVISVDTTGHTCTVDCGQTDAQGNPVYLQGVAFQPQTPPSPGDGVTLAYTNASSHSLYVAGGRLGGGNPQSSITVVGGVSSVAASGDPKLTGDVVIAGTNCTVSQAGNTITITVTAAPTPATTVQTVGAADVVGASALYARQDHVHQGVHKITGGADAFGDVVFTGAGVSQSGNTFTFSGGSGISGIAVQDNDTLVATEAALDFEDSGSVTWTVTDDPTNGRVKISAAAVGGGGSAWTTTKVTLAYTDFIAAAGGGATNVALTIPGIAAGAGVALAKLKHSVQFTGPGTVLQASISDAIGALTPDLGVSTAVSDLNLATNSRGGAQSSGGAVLAVFLDCGTGLVSALTAGSVDVWLVTTPLI
jgi:hypothetical protein